MIKVFNIERFATHDGEGIRTTIFFQGCSLMCPWCANPESKGLNPVLLHDEAKCHNCHKCEAICHKHAIHFKDETLHHVRSLCDSCKKCEKECIHEAINIAGQNMSVKSIMKEISKDDEYYKASNGGITISGGEPFVQFDGLMKLLKELKSAGYHVAIETTGNYDLKQLQMVQPYIDTFLYDVKHFDNQVHKSIVGVDTTKIQNNLRYLCEKDANKVILRIPVIPQFNYMESFLMDVIDMAKEYHVKEVNFLPYHILGKSKFDKMKEVYPWITQSMDSKVLQKYIKIAKDKGVNLKVGG